MRKPGGRWTPSWFGGLVASTILTLLLLPAI